MNDRERITRLEIRCEQLQLTVNEAFHWIDILKSDLSDLQDKVGYADRKTDNSSEIPNNCEYAENPSGDVWECGCFLDTYCEHQIYDRNPDGTINIVECGYEPKTEPQTEPLQTCSVNGRPYTDCCNCEHFRCTADEPQTERSE